MSSYSFEDCRTETTDRQNESISECTLKDLSDDNITRLLKLKISWRRGKQYTSPVTLRGRQN